MARGGARGNATGRGGCPTRDGGRPLSSVALHLSGDWEPPAGVDVAFDLPAVDGWPEAEADDGAIEAFETAFDAILGGFSTGDGD